jgi:hypothetical protein
MVRIIEDQTALAYRYPVLPIVDRGTQLGAPPPAHLYPLEITGGALKIRNSRRKDL